MEYFRFTLFNNVTLLMMAITLVSGIARWRANPRSNWPAAYYLAVAGYTFGFEGSYNRWWLAFGVLCAVAIRGGAGGARWAEAVFFAYVLWRSLGLLLMW